MEPLDLCLDLQRPPKLSLQQQVVREMPEGNTDGKYWNREHRLKKLAER